MNKLNYIVLLLLVSSCASLTGPEGAFPDTKYDFLDEELSEDVVTTDDLELNTCLLYTSPSPRDRQKSRMPSSA